MHPFPFRAHQPPSLHLPPCAAKRGPSCVPAPAAHGVCPANDNVRYNYSTRQSPGPGPCICSCRGFCCGESQITPWLRLFVVLAVDLVEWKNKIDKEELERMLVYGDVDVDADADVDVRSGHLYVRIFTRSPVCH